jgi:cytochrome c oxidase cbb3-type subunit II
MNRPMDRLWVLLTASFVIYALLAIVMGVIPGIVLSDTKPTPGLSPLSGSAARGREVYVSEGCSYCHTQQVRPLAQDLVFGRPSTRGDFAYSTPQLLGTERTGPDLTNIGRRQPSAVWNYIHLYEPRSVVSASIMPAYPWLFAVKAHADRGDVTVPVPPGYAPANAVVVAGSNAIDLVAYLQSLTQPQLGSAK